MRREGRLAILAGHRGYMIEGDRRARTVEFQFGHYSSDEVSYVRAPALPKLMAGAITSVRSASTTRLLAAAAAIAWARARNVRDPMTVRSHTTDPDFGGHLGIRGALSDQLRRAMELGRIDANGAVATGHREDQRATGWQPQDRARSLECAVHLMCASDEVGLNRSGSSMVDTKASATVPARVNLQSLRGEDFWWPICTPSIRIMHSRG